MSQSASPGWYAAPGDAPNTVRYWDGMQWIGEPQMQMAHGAPIQAAYTGPALATPWDRVGARLIDFLIFFVPMIIIGIVIGVGALGAGGVETNFGDSGFMDNLDRFSLGAAFVIAALSYFWEAIWVHVKGGTPGKLIVGLKVVGENGESAAGKKAFMRALNRLVAGIPIIELTVQIVALISLVMLFAHPKHRTVMDFVGGTIVVKE